MTFTYTRNLGPYISTSMWMESTYFRCYFGNKVKNGIRKNYSENKSHLPKVGGKLAEASNLLSGIKKVFGVLKRNHSKNEGVPVF